MKYILDGRTTVCSHLLFYTYFTNIRNPDPFFSFFVFRSPCRTCDQSKNEAEQKNSPSDQNRRRSAVETEVLILKEPDQLPEDNMTENI